MPRNNNPQGHNQYTNKSTDRSDSASERSASSSRDARHDNPGRPSKSESDPDRSSSDRSSRS